MGDFSYKLGDIVKWRPMHMVIGRETEPLYGMIIREPEIIRGGEYSYNEENEAPNLTRIEPMTALTIFSFKDQKVRVIYQSPEEAPLLIEKIETSAEMP